MKEYEVKYITKRCGEAKHTCYVWAENAKEARQEFKRFYAEKGSTAHAFDIQIKLRRYNAE